MGTKTGSLNSGSGRLDFVTPQSLGVTMSAGEYPDGTITFNGISTSATAYWMQQKQCYHPERTYEWKCYLCDSAGNNKVQFMTVSFQGDDRGYNYNYTKKSGTLANAQALAGKALYMTVDPPVLSGSTLVDKVAFKFIGSSTITINTASISYSHTITASAGTGGTLVASKSSATAGEQITLTPTPATGYQFSSYTISPNTVTISANKFTMPDANVTVTANFTKIAYTITKATNPSGAGTVTTKKSGTDVISANYGDSIAIAQTPATGYYFNGWTTSPAVAISSNAFSMPANAITVTANYLKRSTGSLNKSSMDGGSTVTLTIAADKTTYSHKYKLSFGTNMETSLTAVAAGTTSVTISVPLNWSAQIPNATSKGSGTLLLETYNGSTKIGEYTITGLTYTVPASVKPTMGTITLSRGGSGIQGYYVQNYSNVTIGCTASGQQGATITAMSLTMSGYSGSNYSATSSSGSITKTTGMLTIAGTTTINITATDSRGRISNTSTTITVQAYTKPSGSLTVWRVNSGGTADDMGTYAKYSLTKQYTQLGNNALTVTLTGGGSSQSNPGDSGNILPNSRKTFGVTSEYTITLTLTDLLDSVTISVKLPSARFIIYVDTSGNKIGFMKVPNKTIPSGKARTFEISADSQVYIGDDTLEDYINSSSPSIIRELSTINGNGGTKTYTVGDNFQGTLLFTAAAVGAAGMIAIICGSGGVIWANKTAGLSEVTFTTSTNSITITNNAAALAFVSVIRYKRYSSDGDISVST